MLIILKGGPFDGVILVSNDPRHKVEMPYKDGSLSYILREGVVEDGRQVFMMDPRSTRPLEELDLWSND